LESESEKLLRAETQQPTLSTAPEGSYSSLLRLIQRPKKYETATPPAGHAITGCRNMPAKKSGFA
jgi:hypothetical protein